MNESNGNFVEEGLTAHLHNDEDLVNIQQDFNKMPVCAEQIILKLIYYSNKTLRDKIEPFSLNIDTELGLLFERLSVEGLLTNKVDELYKEIKSYLTYKDYSNASRKLKSILCELRDLNIQELLRLTRANNQAVDLIRDRNIYLLIGLTGSGKSTTLHFLGGSKMEKVSINGQHHIEATEVTNEYLKKVKLSASINSETRHIIPVLIKLDKSQSFMEDTAIFCDSPGFEDTNGPEIDISNSIGMQKCVQVCKGVKPIVVTSKLAGDRFQGLAVVSQIMSSMFVNFKEDLKLFSYIYTKYSRDEEDSLKQTLKNIQISLAENEKTGTQIDKSFMCVIEDMIKKSRKKFIVLDPLKDITNEILAELIDEEYIENPERRIKISFSYKSNSIIEKQIQKHFSCIEKSVLRHEYEMALFKLDEVIQLKQLLNQDQVNEQFEKLTVELFKNLNKDFDSCKIRFNKKIEQSKPLYNDDQNEYLNCLVNAGKLQEIVNRLDTKLADKYIELVENLNKYSEIIHKSIISKTNIETQLDMTKINLDNLKIIMNILENLDHRQNDVTYNKPRDFYEKCCNLIKENINEIVNNLKKLLLTDDFYPMATALSLLQTYVNYFIEHIVSDSTNHYDSIKADLKSQFDKKCTDCNSILSDESLNEADVKKISDIDSYFMATKRCSPLHLHVSLDVIETYYNKFTNLIVLYFKNNINEIETEMESIKSSMYGNFETIKNSFKKMKSLRQNAQIESKTSVVYGEALENLVDLIKKIRNNIVSNFNTIMNQLDNNQSDNFKKNSTDLIKNTRLLKKFEWAEELKRNVYTNIQIDLKDILLNHIEDLTSKFEWVTLSLDANDQIKSTYDMVKKMVGLRSLIELYPDLKAPIEDVQEWFKNELDREFKKIVVICGEKNHNSTSIDYEYVNKAIGYLDCITMNKIDADFLTSDFTIAKKKLEDNLKGYYDYIDDRMASLFDTLNVDNQQQAKTAETQVVLSPIDLTRNAKCFARFLKELQSMENYPNMKKYLPKDFNQNCQDWRAKINELRENIEIDIENKRLTNKQEEFNKRLNLVKALRSLDEFVEDTKFSQIFDNYSKSIRNDSQLIFDESKKFIEELDFESLDENLIRLNESDPNDAHYLNILVNKLNQRVLAICVKALDQSRVLDELNKDDIAQLKKDINYIENAKSYTLKYVKKSLQKIDEDLASIKAAVQSCVLKNIERIEESIKRFENNETKVDTIKSLKKDLVLFLDESAMAKVKDLSANMNNLVMESITNFEQYKLEEYTIHSPKEFYDKLIKNNGPNVELAKIQFRKTILQKFSTELAEAIKCVPLSVDNNDYLKKCLRYLDKIPDDIRDEINHLLDDTKREINEKVLNADLSNRQVDTCDFRSLEEQYVKFKSENHTELAERIAKFVRDASSKILNNMDENFSKNEHTEFLKNFSHLFKLCAVFGQHDFISKNDLLINQQTRVQEIFNTSIKTILDAIEHRSVHLTNDLLGKVSHNYQTIKEITDMDRQNSKSNIFNSQQLNYFENNFNNLNVKLNDVYVTCQKSFKMNLETLEVEKLEHLLNVLQFIDGLFKQQQQHCILADSNKPNNGEKMLDYEELKKLLLKKVDNLFNDILKIQFLTNEREVKVQTQFDSFFDDVNKKLTKVKQIKQHLQKHFSNKNFEDYETQCISFLNEQANKFTKDCIALFEKILNSKQASKQEVAQFYASYYNLSSFNKKIATSDSDKDATKLTKNSIEDKLLGLLNSKLDALGKDLEMKDKESACETLILIKSYSNSLFIYQNQINEKIDKYLTAYLKKNGGFKAIGPMALLLKKDAMGNMIVSEHKCFESYNRSLFNTKTMSQKIEYVLKEENLKGDIIDIYALKTHFQQFDKCFKNLIEDYLKPSVDFNILISNMNVKVSNIRSSDPSEIQWDSTLKKGLPELIAHIFALWTLLNANNYFEVASNERESFLFQPHPAQVIAIFRLLGLGYVKGKGEKVKDFFRGMWVSKDETLRKNLVQVGTGEGKSVTLAVCAITLALLGFDVYCVCYSDYLSKRDNTAFKALFDKLQLLEHIHYGTFNKICEHIINEQGDVRKMVEHMIFDKKYTSDKAKKSQRPKVLLIDEVDVFFSKDFYGSSYQPSLEVKHPSVSELVTFIWKHRRADNIFPMVKDSDQFKKCRERFPKWCELILEQVKEMISQINQVETHDYEVQNDQIGYKEQDSIVFDTMYGYKTMFAYFIENERGRISAQSLNEKICMLVSLGSFSYSEIPNNKFYSILGVTGTLQHLNESQKDIIQKTYDIKEFTYMPSVYGRNNLDPRVDILIEEEPNHYAVIVKEINNRMVGKTVGTKRAVFVVFECQKELYKFYRSDEFMPLKEHSSILIEDANLKEKTHIINNSTLSGKITLLTRIFGRGTDFVVHDEIVSANGGVHVIQTFLSEELSEEVQIKGRTARQGENGSYSLVVSRLSLEKFLINNEDLKDATKLYETLNDKRNIFFKEQYSEATSYVDTIRKKHKEATSFLKNLLNSNESAVQEFILAQNKGSILGGNSKTIILMDATGSMSALLDKTKKTLEIMLGQVADVLDEYGYDPNCFQVKIVVYRNYDSPDDEILQSSGWENKAQNLIAFLKGVNVAGGWGNEAIEMGLWLANQEADLSQVILIGDAAANTKDEIDEKRKKLKGNKYKNVKTYYADQADMLKQKKIPVHAFYVDDRAKENFSNIAKMTGGECNELDINSSKGSSDLIKLINIQLLYNIGGRDKGKTLVNAYKTKYNAF